MNYNKEIYELIDAHELTDIGSMGYVLKHKKSGARLVLISNDDENKVFNITFRTPPIGRTGVPHILEHSVLCGSAKYPAKDPFIELAKGSLNTFLNAMTAPDKTMYPIASCNDVDYKNLTDVYMDAVFHPNIYTREQIFKQEGWHYELESVDAPLTYNGVVYNEMKGAYSSADGVLYRTCLNSLYPDTAYATDSGGDPEFIPELTYEQFVGFHKRLYHPSNSYIYVYGNCDMEERLEYFDREYLSKYDAIDPDSELELQKAFDAPRRVEVSYSVTAEEGTQDKAYLAYNASVGSCNDVELSLAFGVLEYALFTAPGAPVKQALIDAGIGEDVTGAYDRSSRQPMVSIIASNTNADREEEFVKVIKDTLKKVVSEGINKKSLKAGINSNEFRFREADFGRYPKGLMYSMTVLDSWIHDEKKPFTHLELGKVFEFLKAQIDTDYFEKLVEKYLINNVHSSVVVLKPEIGLSAKKDEAAAKKLAEYKATLSMEELEALVADTKALKEYQSTPSTKEELEKIPMLKREDMSREVMPFCNEEREVEGVKLIHHNINTNGIGYLKLSFNIDKVEDELLPYVGLLAKVMGNIGTKSYSYSELANEIDINTGGINFSFNAVPINAKENAYRASVNVTAKALYDSFDFTVETIQEIINNTVFEDYKRLKEIIGEVKMSMQSSMEYSGNAVAIYECMAQKSEMGALRRLVSGRGEYKFIDDLYKNFDDKKEACVANLKKVAAAVFGKDNLLISFTADNKGCELMSNELTGFLKQLNTTGLKSAARKLELKKIKLALKTGGQVCYVARCGGYEDAGYKYNGALKILSTIMGLEYLWINVRVKGGAYGCSASFGGFNSDYSCFSSYRDPNIKETNAIYENIPEYVAGFTADEREMTKYIIGTISELDIPKNPSAKGARSFDAYIRGISEEKLKAERAAIIDANEDSIRALADITKAVLDEGYFCVVGSEEKINANKDMFDVIENLI